MGYIYLVVILLMTIRLVHYSIAWITDDNAIACAMIWIDAIITFIFFNLSVDYSIHIYLFSWTAYFCIVYFATLCLECYKSIHWKSEVFEIHHESINFHYNAFTNTVFDNSFYIITKPCSYVKNIIKHKIIKLKYKD